MLVAKHFHLLSPPGCGAGGGCDQAARSPLGSIPLGDTKWPVSSVGLAFYTAMLAALVATRGRVTPALRWMARLGALISAFYIFMLILHRKEYFCIYCLTSHLANFGFLATVELAVGPPTKALGNFSKRSLVAAAAAFALTSAAMGVGEIAAKNKSERQASASADEIIEKAKANAAKPTTEAVKPPAPEPVKPKPSMGTINGETWEALAARKRLPLNIDESVSPQGFTGRWRIGPEDAPIRIVAFSDYQCPDCKRFEDEVREIMLKRNDVSFSHKHFPFNTECNPQFKAKRSPHPNACWAARAAETAGMLHGNRGFWEMHFWLYDLKNEQGVATQGTFTDPVLIKGLQEMGYDSVEFQRIMQSPDPLHLIAAECEEASTLGLMFTPLVYINGVEFRPWNSPGALTRAIEKIAASNPPKGTAVLDQPAGALAKALEDWRVSYRFPDDQLARQGFSMASGSENASINIIYWGDYEDESTHQLYEVIKAQCAGRSDVRIDFRHFPFNEDCNMFAEREDHKVACAMAKAAEAAGRLGGPDAFWKMHDWLMQTGAKYTEEAMQQFATSQGLDPKELLTQANGDEIRSTITLDAQKLKNTVNGRFVPTVIVNNRMVPRWKLNDGSDVIKSILDEAAKDNGANPAGQTGK